MEQVQEERLLCQPMPRTVQHQQCWCFRQWQRQWQSRIPTEDNTLQVGSTQQGTGHVQITRWNLFNNIIKASNFVNFSQLMWNPLLLDDQSTDDMFCNDECLIDIHCINEALKLSTNSSILTTNMKGTFPGYGLVWCHPKAIANISSQSRVEDQGHIITHQRGSHKVTGPKGHVHFNHITEGLHASKLDQPTNQPTNNKGVTPVETIENNKLGFIKHQVQHVEQVLRLQEMIMFPSIANFKNVIQMNLIWVIKDTMQRLCY